MHSHTTESSTDPSTHQDRSHHRSSGISKARAAAAVIALSLGCFTFVSTELMPVGVLPMMAEGLHVSLGAAGYLVTIFAFMVALTAAPLTSLLGGLNRKVLMAGLLAVCCIGNLVTFLAPGYFVVFLGRILVAAAIGVFWSTAVVTAVHMVSSRNAVRATSIVFGGVSLAAVLGIPAGTMLGDMYSWRAVFAALSVLSLLVFTIVAWSVPAVRITKTAKRGAMSSVLRSGPLLAVFGITALVVTGNFLAYTYVTPYLEQMAGQSPAQISMLLLVYGVAGVVTNFAIGPFASRAPRTSLGLVTALFTLSLACTNSASGSTTAIFIALAAWGAAYGALPVLLQTLVFKEASRIPGAADAATAINVSVFNAAIGLGSLLGGMLINLAGPHPIPYLSACFGLAGLLAIVVSREGKARHR
ncbi:MFS transporter [Comamonas sp. JUb58]|uniref:MFS transporter n=1 Tax=Comamonas sp. JUb58 TaxID=2485114 RepID=UPI0010EE7EE5|nr:MFS transporter [Comamonas sp. JUb58]TDS84999.1 putative MFS family arabinose efflux permease [Comamonas sp. JUb58]